MNNEIYESRGGGWWGWQIQATWPFVTLSLYKIGITFSILGFKKEIVWSDIEVVKRILTIPLIGDALVIVPKLGVDSKIIVFWGFRNTQVLKVMRDYDIQISRNLPKRALPITIFIYAATMIIYLMLAILILASV